MKTIFKTLLSCAIIFGFQSMSAQNNAGKSDDLGRIALNSYVSDDMADLPASARRMLKNKLDQIATKNGMGGSAINGRFIITANVVTISKDLTSSAPPMTALGLEVSFYIGDGIEGTKFASTSISVKGVGTNESKAYTAAMKQIKPANSSIQAFVQKGKSKIVEYYNSNCDFILKKAEALQAQNKYEEAILQLTTVPEICKDCYNKCMDAVEPIYQKQIDRECETLMAEANNAWNSSQDAAAADKASKALAKIDPRAECFKEAQDLTTQIAARIKELDDRDWDFKMKEYDTETDLRQETIKAAKEVGVAYGKNQPEKVEKADPEKVEEWTE